jgi:hypothetical protein
MPVPAISNVQPNLWICPSCPHHCTFDPLKLLYQQFSLHSRISSCAFYRTWYVLGFFDFCLNLLFFVGSMRLAVIWWRSRQMDLASVTAGIMDRRCSNNRRHMVVCRLMRFGVVDSNLFDVMISSSNFIRFKSCPVQIVETCLNGMMSFGVVWSDYLAFSLGLRTHVLISLKSWALLNIILWWGICAFLFILSSGISH